eukprot:TRINITY_DN17561_c0_g1_i1.p1 TRINITY_DN17561_c0_g1~~TRINITY_DN17561_c0_g1_i1.p1  ORF type:complete len:513 (-),score=138.19 TRINITY_DN17561_c0_g1_i1:254-1792(-)
MFGDFGDFGGADFGTDLATKVFVRNNITAGPLKEVRLPPNSKLVDLFEKCSKVLDIDAPQRAYYSNGVECTDVENLENDEILHISCGEPFKAVDKPGAREIVGNYILHDKLGQGGFGSVYKGLHSETGEAAAIKFVAKKSFRQFSDLQRVFQEIQALRNLRHQNVIRILDVADHPTNICFILEYAAGGELRGYVEKAGSLSEEESRTFFKQIVRAVHYIHSKKTIHRDLKLENILLDASNRCKIVDFGLSDYVSSKEQTVTDAGTEAYLAPEVYNGCSKDSDPYKIDVWGLGVILYALAHGKLPFYRPDEETCAKLDADGLQFKEELSTGYRRLVKAMLTPSPERRASVDEITLDPWVTKHRFAQCEEHMCVPGFVPEEPEDDEGVEGAASCEAFESEDCAVDKTLTDGSMIGESSPPRDRGHSLDSDGGGTAAGRRLVPPGGAARARATPSDVAESRSPRAPNGAAGGAGGGSRREPRKNTLEEGKFVAPRQSRGSAPRSESRGARGSRGR